MDPGAPHSAREPSVQVHALSPRMWKILCDTRVCKDKKEWVDYYGFEVAGGSTALRKKCWLRHVVEGSGWKAAISQIKLCSGGYEWM